MHNKGGPTTSWLDTHDMARMRLRPLFEPPAPTPPVGSREVRDHDVASPVGEKEVRTSPALSPTAQNWAGAVPWTEPTCAEHETLYRICGCPNESRGLTAFHELPVGGVVEKLTLPP
jgi:hypothetical protein